MNTGVLGRSRMPALARVGNAPGIPHTYPNGGGF
jgi:hypothetical protein